MAHNINSRIVEFLLCIHEDVGSIPGLTLWVKDLVLSSAVVLVEDKAR